MGLKTGPIGLTLDGTGEKKENDEKGKTIGMPDGATWVY